MATTRETKAKSSGSRSKSKENKVGSKPSATEKKAARPTKRAASGSATRTKARTGTGAGKASKKNPVGTAPKLGGAVRAKPTAARPVVSKDSTREAAARDLAVAIAAAALDKKAESVEVIDIRGRVDYADFLVVMSGRSDRHVVAVAQGVEQTLKQQGHKCLGVEGLPQGQWVLMDYADVIAHVFHSERRGFYDLDGLWLDAERVPFASGAKAAAGG